VEVGASLFAEKKRDSTPKERSKNPLKRVDQYIALDVKQLLSLHISKPFPTGVKGGGGGGGGEYQLVSLGQSF